MEELPSISYQQYIIILNSLHGSQQFFSYIIYDRTGLPVMISTNLLSKDDVSCSRTQGSDAGEARTRKPSVSSQAPYHYAPYLLTILTNLSVEANNLEPDQTAIVRST